jgi:hypothetical protein
LITTFAGALNVALFAGDVMVAVGGVLDDGAKELYNVLAGTEKDATCAPLL